jgi:hypothetical protein
MHGTALGHDPIAVYGKQASQRPGGNPVVIPGAKCPRCRALVYLRGDGPFETLAGAQVDGTRGCATRWDDSAGPVAVTVTLALLLAVVSHQARPPVLVSILLGVPTLYVAWLAVPGVRLPGSAAAGKATRGRPATSVGFGGAGRASGDRRRPDAKAERESAHRVPLKVRTGSRYVRLRIPQRDIVRRGHRDR